MVGHSGLSARQVKMLQVIRDYSEEYGYPPTIREIGDLVGSRQHPWSATT